MNKFDINAIKAYLLKEGCKVEYPRLVNAFKDRLCDPDPNVQGKIRTQFKDYVNRLATVSAENVSGRVTKFIILRPEFRYDQQELSAPTTNGYQPEQRQSVQPPVGLTSDNRHQNSHQNENSKLKQQQAHLLLQQGSDSKQYNQQQQTTIPPPTPPASIVVSPLGVTQRAPNNQVQILTQQQQPMLPPPIPQHLHQKQLSNPVSASQLRQNYALQWQSHSQPLSPQCQLASQQHSNMLATSVSQQQRHNQLYYQQQHQPQQPIATRATTATIVDDSVDAVHGDIIDSTAKIHSKVQQQLQPQPPVTKRSHLMQRPESLNLSPSQSEQMPPPRPPPRRRQSTASLFKQTVKPVEKSREIHELARKIPGRVKEHALKLNSVSSASDLNALLPIRSTTMKENRLSRDSSATQGNHHSAAFALQRNGSHVTSRSRSSHREDESDSSSLQPIDPLRRKWAIEACNCNYNGLMNLLREDPKLASYKDIVNGYTALHWAAKFGNLDIIKLIAGTNNVSANIKSSAGYTPLHVAYMFNRTEAANLLLKSYKANPDIRDHSGKRPMQYWRQKNQLQASTTTK